MRHQVVRRMHEKSIGKIGQLHRECRVARPSLPTNLTSNIPIPLPYYLRVIALEVPTRRGVMAPSSEKLRYPSVKSFRGHYSGRGIEYDALRECAGTLCVADLQSQLDRLTIFRLDTSLLESLVSSSLTGSHIEILRTEYYY